MAKIIVYPFTYYDQENGIRRDGSGMCTAEMILNMRAKDGEKAHEIVSSKGIEIDDSELSATLRYYPPED